MEDKKAGSLLFIVIIIHSKDFPSSDCRGTQREYSSKPLKHNIVERILVFKR